MKVALCTILLSIGIISLINGSDYPSGSLSRIARGLSGILMIFLTMYCLIKDSK